MAEFGQFSVDSSVFNCGSTADSWESMKAVFTEKGLRVIDPKENDFAIVRYDRARGKLEPDSVWLRSVVFNKNTLRVVCVAPPRATELSNESWPDMKDIDVQDFIDGTMMNLFWTEDHEVQVVTRSRLGADNNFYGQISFVDMLKEAVALYMNGNPTFKGELNDLKPSNKGVSQFISVVLQHPANRVVTEVLKPRITVVHSGWVDTDGVVHVTENMDLLPEHLAKLAPAKFSIPSENLVSLEALADYVDKQGESLGHMWQGYTLKNGAGVRYRIRNKLYVQVRSLRGNESDSTLRFCRLRRERNTKRYLKFYPEDESVFYKFEGVLRVSTRKLIELYTATFKFKKQAFHQLPWPYKHHVSVLHNEYKDTLKSLKKTVDIAYVIEYMNALKPDDMCNFFKEPKPKRTVAPAVASSA